MEAKTQPVSVRLPPDVDRYIASEAKRVKRSKGWILQSILSEGMRCRLFPGIAFRGPDSDRQAWVIGTALDVWEIIQAFGDFRSLDAMVEDSHLSERQIRLALEYYARFPTEIDEAIAANDRPIEELARELPGARIVLIDR